MTSDVLPADELQRRIRQVEPAALLVPPRILRRVIKIHKGLGGFGLTVPHRRSYILDRDALLRIVTPAELGLAPGEALPETVLLFPRPEQPRPAGVQLLRYWRLLFHLEVHRAFDSLRAEGRLQGESLHRRIHTLGHVAFEEIRDVLRQENLLFAPDDPAAVYEEFAAVYLDIRHFDRERLEFFFPSLVDRDAVDRLLAADVDAAELFQRTRPPGAPDPGPEPPDETPPGEVPPVEKTTTAPSVIRVRAEQVARAGNQVRAALLLERAAAASPHDDAVALHAGAGAELESLAGRLQRALGFPPEERGEWTRCLLALLPAAAAARFWNAEVRLLYDLQKACIDMERPLYAADLIEWVVTWFRRPIKRSLPDQPFVLIVNHLRSALNRLPAARMPAAARQRLGDLLRAALHEAEQRMRLTFEPQIVEALDAVGLAPRTVAERLSRDQLVEELLDTIGRRGTISIGDLRDAIARSRLKLPGLRGPGEFFTGDPLIRANRELAAKLEGVYRRGEIYLRWLQRLGSVFFGTAAGRLLTLYAIVPLLGSLLILKGIEELLHIGGAVAARMHRSATSFDFPGEEDLLAEEEAGAHGVQLFNVYSFLGLAAFLIPMIHSPPFRHAVFRGLWYAWLGVRFVLYDGPAAFLRLPFVRAIIQSKPYQLFWQYVGKPALWVVPITAVLLACRVPLPWTAVATALLFALVSYVSNTRLGLLLEEALADWLVRTWQLVRDDLLPGLIGFFIWASKYVFDRIERFMYAVDEMLRFRQGQSRLAFVAKLVLGLVWFLFTYVFRLVYNVFFEPQVNPIKHFPVVTVAHKLTLPLIPVAKSAMETQLGLRPDLALTLATGIQVTTPGMWGFLAWELKENWRLYRANQAPELEPALVGSHGERVINFIRPGFHSGTLPRLFAKLRRAVGKKRRRAEEALHHVEEELRHFVARELFATLAVNKKWPAEEKLTVGKIVLATNRIRIELLCPHFAPESCWLDFTNRGGRLVAAVPVAGWLSRLNVPLREVAAAAWTGFYKRAGVDLLAEQLEGVFPAGAEYEIHEGKMAVTVPGVEGAVTYDLENPHEPARPARPGLPADAGAFLFRERTVAWEAWVEHWQRDAAGETRLPPLVPGMRMLPGAEV
jgi:hypothetical protein